MSLPDLYFAAARCTAKNVKGRPKGEERFVMAWARPGGGKEEDVIRQKLGEIGWDVIDFRAGKEVSSQDDGADATIREALAQAREEGFAFLVYSQPPK